MLLVEYIVISSVLLRTPSDAPQQQRLGRSIAAGAVARTDAPSKKPSLIARDAPTGPPIPPYNSYILMVRVERNVAPSKGALSDGGDATKHLQLQFQRRLSGLSASWVF